MNQLVEGLPDSGQAGDRLIVRQDPPNAEIRPEALGDLITSVEDRFLRCHFPLPSERPGDVLLSGAVAHGARLSLEDLKSLHAVTLTALTECAGNHRTSLHPKTPGEQWRGGAVSTGQWTGTPLRALLERAGLKETAVEILFAGADRGETPDGVSRQFLRSLPLEKALDPDTLVVYELNGEPIPHRFGGPVRLLVPGWYGMASVKWLERIEALETPFDGYFQTTKYVYAPGEQVGRIRVKSLFTSPGKGESLRRAPLVVRGLAWGGQGGVARVEVSTGCTDHDWREARLIGPSLPYAWRRFELTWTPPQPGRYVLRCRATAGDGEQQPDAPVWNPLGYGANAVEHLAVTVK